MCYIKLMKSLSFILLLCLGIFFVYAEEVHGQDVEERLTNLEREVAVLNAKLDEGFKAINQRFDDMNQRFNYIYILLAAIIALNGAMVGSVVWLARQERPIGQRQYDTILGREDIMEREIRALKSEIEALKLITNNPT